ncbi:MAG: hypothetical protein AAFQ02_03705 [Bacteroidota bacterium]
MKVHREFQIFSCVVALMSGWFSGFGQLSLLSDEFDDSRSLSNWNDINVTEGWGIQPLEWYSIDDSLEGHFQIAPYTSSWFNEWKGSLLFKEVAGDFVITTEVKSRSRSSDNRPQSQFSLAGIMVRAAMNYDDALASWEPNEQDYIFLAMGNADGNCSANKGCHAQLENKTTNNSNSTLQISNIGSNHAQLRVARIGRSFILLYRELPNGEWAVHQRFLRSDLPDTVQVGLTTYTDWPKVNAVGHTFHNRNVLVPGVPNDPAPSVGFEPDLIGDFDFYRIEKYQAPDSLSGATFANDSEVSNEELLEQFGAINTLDCQDRLHITDQINMPFLSARADTMTFSSDLAAGTTALLYGLEVVVEPNVSLFSGVTAEIYPDGCE